MTVFGLTANHDPSHFSTEGAAQYSAGAYATDATAATYATRRWHSN